jgi:hypothetical protein
VAQSLLIPEVTNHTQRYPTVGRTPWMNDQSVADLYLTTHNTHNRQTSMPSVGFKPTVSAGQRPQTYALDGEATGTGEIYIYTYIHTSLFLLKTTSLNIEFWFLLIL